MKTDPYLKLLQASMYECWCYDSYMAIAHASGYRFHKIDAPWQQYLVAADACSDLDFSLYRLECLVEDVVANLKGGRS